MNLYKGKLTLYIKSDKTAVANERLDIKFGSGRVLASDDISSITRYEFILPWNQEAIVEMVKDVASRHFFELEVVDVTREDVLHRFLHKEVKRLKIFPTLTADSGVKIEGNISKRELELLLSRVERSQKSDLRL